MHVLKLSDIDTRILRKAVETRLAEMNDELDRADNTSERERLRRDVDRLAAIGRTIGATVESERTLY